mmetsp:Transcript_41340/g.93980  ORF Transcript_41340/g.93980 Transcript_41340/m.93980 type:complete len:251 (+) Transcript_41340:175-927(+)
MAPRRPSHTPTRHLSALLRTWRAPWTRLACSRTPTATRRRPPTGRSSERLSRRPGTPTACSQTPMHHLSADRRPSHRKPWPPRFPSAGSRRRMPPAHPRRLTSCHIPSLPDSPPAGSRRSTADRPCPLTRPSLHSWCLRATEQEHSRRSPATARRPQGHWEPLYPKPRRPKSSSAATRKQRAATRCLPSQPPCPKRCPPSTPPACSRRHSSSHPAARRQSAPSAWRGNRRRSASADSRKSRGCPSWSRPS